MKQATAPQLYKTLLESYGPQHWWPADSPFEMMIGAILTQNTNWKNVERAIINLKSENLLNEESIADCDTPLLAEAIRPSGFYRQKAERLQLFSRFFIRHGRTSGLKREPVNKLRNMLLQQHGIGPETADSMLLYALGKPVFVVDAYTKRIFSRIGLFSDKQDYMAVQAYFHQHLIEDLSLFQEYHALIVEHAKRFCKARPSCEACPMNTFCLHFSSLSHT